MTKSQLAALYEKLYFHEIDVREKLNGRLQMPMAIIISLAGVVGFLIQKVDFYQFGWVEKIFAALLTIDVFLLSVSAYYFIRSWYGITYSFLPSAEETEKYKNLLKETYKQFEKRNELTEKYFEEYINTYYIKCSTQNTHCNDKRSLNLHKTNGRLIISTLFILTSFVFFSISGIGNDKIKKPNEIIIIKPVDIKGYVMTEEKNNPPKVVTPPPPPPPPPPRQIREGVEIIHPTTENQNGKR
jgi:hypothetical protein